MFRVCFFRMPERLRYCNDQLGRQSRGFVGPFVIGWLKNVTGGYSAGLYVVAATLAVSAVVTLMLSRRARQTHAPVGERHRH